MPNGSVFHVRKTFNILRQKFHFFVWRLERKLSSWNAQTKFYFYDHDRQGQAEERKKEEIKRRENVRNINERWALLEGKENEEKKKARRFLMQIFLCVSTFEREARGEKWKTFSLNENVQVPKMLKHKAESKGRKLFNFLQFMFEQNNHIFKWHLKLFSAISSVAECLNLYFYGKATGFLMIAKACARFEASFFYSVLLVVILYSKISNPRKCRNTSIHRRSKYIKAHYSVSKRVRERESLRSEGTINFSLFVCSKAGREGKWKRKKMKTNLGTFYSQRSVFPSSGSEIHKTTFAPSKAKIRW